MSERKVHNVGCFVEYHGPLSHAPERKVHNFASFVKKGPKFVLEKVQNLKCPPLGDLIKISLRRDLMTCFLQSKNVQRQWRIPGGGGSKNGLPADCDA